MANIKVCDNCRDIIGKKIMNKTNEMPFFAIAINIPYKQKAPENMNALLEKLGLKEGHNDICIECIKKLVEKTGG